MGSIRIVVPAVGIVLALGTALVAQQHSYTQADIDAGKKLYESNCGSCHGENGDKIVGIDFSKGAFKTAKSDDDIIRIIRSGVPNTGMPPSPLAEVQANTIVAFVRSMLGGPAADRSLIAGLTGDAARGKTIFEGKGNCLSCHPVNGAGGTSAPDLGPVAAGGGRGRGGAPAGAGFPPGLGGAPPAGAPAAGGRGRGGAPGAAGGARGGGAPAAVGAPPAGGGGGGRGGGGGAPNPQQLERAIVDPSAEMAPPYRIYQIVTKANVTARGTLLNQDTFSLQMRDTSDKLMAYWKQDLRDYGFLPSPMPSYKDKLTGQEIADLVSYLVSLRTN